MMELLINVTTVATFVRFISMLQGVELSFPLECEGIEDDPSEENKSGRGRLPAAGISTRARQALHCPWPGLALSLFTAQTPTHPSTSNLHVTPVT